MNESNFRTFPIFSYPHTWTNDAEVNMKDERRKTKDERREQKWSTRTGKNRMKNDSRKKYIRGKKVTVDATLRKTRWRE